MSKELQEKGKKFYQYTAIDEYSRLRYTWFTNAQGRFYNKRVFYSLEDLRNQGKEWRKEYNNFPMRPLGWLSPREFIEKYKSQEESLFAI